MGQCFITRRGGGAGNLDDYLKKYLVSDYSASLNRDVITIPYDKSRSLFCKDNWGKYWVIPLVAFETRIGRDAPFVDVYTDSSRGTFYFGGAVTEGSLRLGSGFQYSSGGGQSANFNQMFTEMKILKVIQ